MIISFEIGREWRIEVRGNMIYVHHVDEIKRREYDQVAGFANLFTAQIRVRLLYILQFPEHNIRMKGSG